MNNPNTFDVIDEGLNNRLDRLTRTLDSTNRTLESASKDLIETSVRQSRLHNKFQIIYLLLTAFIVIVASFSAYFAYKSVKISSGQKSLQTAQFILDIVTDVKETIQDMKAESIEPHKDLPNKAQKDKAQKLIGQHSQTQNGGQESVGKQLKEK